MEKKMSAETKIYENIEVQNAPEIEGLTFRGFRGEDDYPVMLEIINAVKIADEDDRADTLEDIRRGYAHLQRSDPYKDMLFAEVNAEPAGYSRVWWDEELNGPHLYSLFVFLKSEWRATGLSSAMLDHQLSRLREIAQEHPADAKKFFQMWASSTEEWYQGLMESKGFQPVRYAFSMTRPASEPVEITPLPEGIEVRPVKPEQYRQVWEADQEAFQDHWGFVPGTEEDYKRWLEWPSLSPDLWQVAWDGDEVAGMVLNFIDKQQNEEYDRKRGYTEGISVRRPWRRQGVARGLLTRSIKMFQEMGMEETALGVDVENPRGALNLYESVGYKETKRYTTFRKEMDQ
jgi:ribosomal protein S18 acetylase RimI-like enzyme